MIVKDYWNERYAEGGNSGYGSYGTQLQKKLDWLSALPIETITEVGCGDFHFGENLLARYPDAHYCGLDISDVIIAKNKELHPTFNFQVFQGQIPPADLLMCVDVLFHIVDENEYEAMLDGLQSASWKYLAVTAYERDEPDVSPHLNIKKFDYKRFGEPVIREVVEEDGQLYFYLFKKPETFDWSKVSCCLNTKEDIYPEEVLNYLNKVGFGEILIKTHSDSPYCKYEMITKAKYETIYYQDDDAICPIQILANNYQQDKINVLMKPSHFESYKDRRMTMGLGWGCLFEKSFLNELKKYVEKYGEDDLMRRDTEKLLTHLVGREKQNRISAPIQDLPNAMAPGRISMQPEHYSNMDLIEERCKILL